MKRSIIVLAKSLIVCSAVGLLSSCVFVIDARDNGSSDATVGPVSTEAAVAQNVSVNNAYSVVCRTDNNEPVGGVMLKVCSDKLCTLLMTDEQGKALYPASDGRCEICVMSFPENYDLVDDKCIVTSEGQSEYYFGFTADDANDSQTEGSAQELSAVSDSGSLTADISGDSVVLKWSKYDSADAYRVYMCDESGKNCHSLTRTSDTDYTVKNIAADGTYIFKVVALKKDGGIFTETETVGSVKLTADGIAAVTTEAAIASPVEETHETTASLPKWNTYDFAIYDTNGKKLMLSDFAGKAVVVNVWATWCGYCVDELLSFEKIYDSYGNDVQFIMLNCDGRGYESDVASFMDRNGYSFPVYYDYDFNSSRYFGDGIPVTVAINRGGELETLCEGAASETELEAIVKSLLSRRRSITDKNIDRKIKLGETEKIRR